MAAVAASLAAFLAGCGLPGLPGSLVARDAAGQRQERETLGAAECHLGGADWASEWQPGREIAAVVVKAPPRKAANAGGATGACSGGAAIAGRQPAPSPAVCGPTVTEDVAIVSSARPPAEAVSAAAALVTPSRPLRSKQGTPRQVVFDLSKITQHEITPYAEVYGVHPRDFNFARGRYAPTACFSDPDEPPRGGCSSDSDDDDEELAEGRLGRLQLKTQRLIGMSHQVPPHLWFAACVLCFLIRVFGVQIFLEVYELSHSEHSGWPKVLQYAWHD